MNKLVDVYNNIYHCSTGKKPIHFDYSALSEEFEWVIKILNLNLVIIESVLINKKIFLVKIALKNG